MAARRVATVPQVDPHPERGIGLRHVLTLRSHPEPRGHLAFCESTHELRPAPTYLTSMTLADRHPDRSLEPAGGQTPGRAARDPLAGRVTSACAMRCSSRYIARDLFRLPVNGPASA